MEKTKQYTVYKSSRTLMISKNPLTRESGRRGDL